MEGFGVAFQRNYQPIMIADLKYMLQMLQYNHNNKPSWDRDTALWYNNRCKEMKQFGMIYPSLASDVLKTGHRLVEDGATTKLYKGNLECVTPAEAIKTVIHL